MDMDVVILAAGKGTRMYSTKPKVLHQLGGKAMLEHVIDAACSVDANNIHVVIGYGAKQIEQYFTAHAKGVELCWAIQAQQLGTGHAVLQAMPGINTENDEKLVLILYGDVPLIKSSTLHTLLSSANANTLSLLTLSTDTPTGLGRIIRNGDDSVVAIVEEKDASEDQKAIKEINSGIMVVPAKKLNKWLTEVGNSNQQGEYYLTDIIALAVNDGCNIDTTIISDSIEVQGVNDKIQLALLERHFQMNKAKELLQAGVTLRDPARIDIRGELHTGADVEIDVNTLFEGEVTLGDRVIIGANSIIKDATIGDGTKILPGTSIDGAVIGENTLIGPYARIRPGTILKNAVKIGNFVEIKNSTIGEGSKANHLAYVGDAEIGKNVNIGAGTIVCNYDGAYKHKTIIGDNVFVGSNSVLVAPINLADDAFVAAGSAINSDVPSNTLAIGRSKQRNIPGWKRPVKRES